MPADLGKILLGVWPLQMNVLLSLSGSRHNLTLTFA